MSTLRALYLLPAASFGGAERQAAQIIGRLPRHGIDVIPMVGPGRRIVEFLEDAGVLGCLFRGDLPDDPKAPRGLLARGLLVGGYVRSYFRVAAALEREARRHRADVLFASRPFAWVVAGIVGERLGLPVVWRAGTHFEHWVQPPLLSRFARWRRPRAVIYTSEAVRRALGDAMRAPSFVLHNGVDLLRFAPLDEATVARHRGALAVPGVPTVGLVARIAPEKGTDTFVALCRGLARQVPAVRVLLAGDSGWRRWLEQRLRAEGLDETVRLLGFVRQIERVYAASDVVVSTSAAEGCPNAVLEAMAMGRPVVATDVGGTREILRHGQDGVLVGAGDLGGFVAEVAALLVDAPRRRALGEAAASQVVARFSLDVQVARLAAILGWAAGRAVDVEPPPSTQPAPARGAAPSDRGRAARSCAAAVTAASISDDLLGDGAR